jgi:DNA-binding PadR family transcriptional regulator
MRRRTRRRARRPLPDLAYLVLGHVRGHPAGIHGYRLGQRLAAAPLGVPAVRLAQLYRLLHELGRRGLVACRVEAGGTRPARLVFSITPAGTTAFQRWLTGPPRGAVPVRDQLLQRLHFADAFAGSALRRFLRDAARECAAELDAVRATHAPAADGRETPGAASALVALALDRRLSADRDWLAEIERLLDADGSRAGAETGRSGVPRAGDGCATVV